MAREINFGYGTVVPSQFLNDQQDLQSAAAWGILFTQTGNTIISLSPAQDGSASGQSSININGQPCHITGPLTYNFSGQPANAYYVFLVAGPGGTFALAVLPSTATPNVPYRGPVAVVSWNGSAITQLANTVGVNGHAYQHAINGPDPLPLTSFVGLPPGSATNTMYGVQVNGNQSIVQPDNVAAVTWQFRYNANSSSAEKWEFIGGAPLLARQSSNGFSYTTLTGGALQGFTDLSAPQIIVPFTGDYDYEVQFTTYVATTGTFIVSELTLVNRADNTAYETFPANTPLATLSGTNPSYVQLAARGRVLGVPWGTHLVPAMALLSAPAVSMTISGAVMRLRPVRVQ